MRIAKTFLALALANAAVASSWFSNAGMFISNPTKSMS
jgi:hypothetical protein